MITATGPGNKYSIEMMYGKRSRLKQLQQQLSSSPAPQFLAKSRMAIPDIPASISTGVPG